MNKKIPKYVYVWVLEEFFWLIFSEWWHQQESPRTEGFLTGLILVGICFNSDLLEPSLCVQHTEAKTNQNIEV